jgi:lipoprotein NlpI
MLALILPLLFWQSTWQDWNRQGEQQFREAAIDASIKSFDQAIKLEPRLAPHHWQRGISLYYAERWKDCAEQFELHRTVNPEDVENAVWHYLCVARTQGREAARKKFIPTKADTRVPMAQIHALFSGNSTPDRVLSAAGSDQNALFYAHLYLGLYWESMDDADKARQHLRKAARDFAADHYMGDVARIHCSRRKW